MGLRSHSTGTDPRAEYDRRLAAWRERIAALDRVNFIISNIRLAIAGAGAVLLWMAFVRASISPRGRSARGCCRSARWR